MKPVRKLNLNREVLTELTTEEMQAAVGGGDGTIVCIDVTGFSCVCVSVSVCGISSCSCP